jgi:hypothetical protein
MELFKRHIDAMTSRVNVYNGAHRGCSLAHSAAIYMLAACLWPCLVFPRCSACARRPPKSMARRGHHVCRDSVGAGACERLTRARTSGVVAASGAWARRRMAARPQAGGTGTT